MITELVTRPISAAIALVELPLTMRRSLEEANQLMETSRRQLEQMQRQTDNALDQAERMNELLSRVVRLTEPIEKAQRGGEFAAGIAKRMIFGEAEKIERAADDAEAAAEDAERAAAEAEKAADVADDAAEEAAEVTGDEAEATADGDGSGESVRIIPNRPPLTE